MKAYAVKAITGLKTSRGMSSAFLVFDLGKKERHS
jgi:hypothetical protein